MRFNIFNKREEIIPEALIALKGKFPDALEVEVKPSKDGGYVAKIKNLKGCITQAEDGQELFEMVNDAVYTYLDVPPQYIPYLPTFFPSEEIRQKMGIKIPQKYLSKELVFERR